jgi:PIN domain
MQPEGASIVSVKGLIFIDANQYLNLYAIPSGKILLAALQEQRGHILVTTQVVDEVHRNKVKVTASFLNNQFKKFELDSIAVPVHLLGNANDRVARMGEQLEKTRRKVKETEEEFKRLTYDVLEQVSQSKDEMSKGLATLFARAVPPNEDELRRARARRERGNPPGKQDDPLGDQLSWEQILSHCEDKPRLWIITTDSDYGSVYAGKMFLNAALYQDLVSLYQSDPEVFCFDDIDKGLRHFVNTTGAKAEKLPTPEETEQIKKEQESLRPNGWLINYDDAGHIFLQIYDAHGMRDSTPLRAVLAMQVNSEEVIPPPAT